MVLTRVVRAAFFVMLVLLPFLAFTKITAHPTSITSAFRLPAAAGLNVYVFQGNNDKLHDHVGKAKYAFDFTVGSTNFVVTAAQGGTIMGADDSSTTGCADVSCWTQANYVVIADDDGTTAALYLHLLHNSLKVKTGMHVNQGEPLGLADTTGWATGPHLHFQVENIPNVPAQPKQSPGWWWAQSVPVSFSNPEVLAQDANGVPQEGQSFLVSNPPTLTPSQTLSAYCNAQKNGDSQTVFDLLPQSIQVHMNHSLLIFIMHEILAKNAKNAVITNCKVESVSVSKDGNTAIDIIVYTMSNGWVLRINEPLVKENGTWKVVGDKATLVSAQIPTPTPPVPVPTPTPNFKLVVNPNSIAANDPNVCPNGKCPITLSSPSSNNLSITWKATITVRAGAGTLLIGSVSPTSGTLAPGQAKTVFFIISSFICGDITGSTITFTGGVSPVVVQLSGSFGPC